MVKVENTIRSFYIRSILTDLSYAWGSQWGEGNWERQRIVLVDEPALFGGDGDSLVFLSPLTFFFYLFVIFPLPAVVANVGVDHLFRIFSLEFIEHVLVKHSLFILQYIYSNGCISCGGNRQETRTAVGIGLNLFIFWKEGVRREWKMCTGSYVIFLVCFKN